MRPESRFPSRMRPISTLFCAAAVLFAAALTGGCDSVKESPQSAESEKLPDQEVTEFSLTETVGGVKSWTLFAERAEVFDAAGYSKVYGVRVLFYDDKGEITSVLTSQRGRVDDKSKDLQAFGDVLVETSDGVTLRTRSLHWDNRRAKIWSNEFVTVTREREVVTGYGFDSDPDLRNAQIRSQVEIKVREGQGEGGAGELGKPAQPEGGSAEKPQPQGSGGR
jgi:LPS export ABC transporter protein LptC